MTSDNHTSQLAILKAAGIVTAEQHRRALADPDAAELKDVTDLSAQLLWLVARDIVSDQDLANARTRVADTFSGEEQARYDTLLREVQETVATIDSMADDLTDSSLEALRAAGLLTQAEHDLLRSKVPPDALLYSPAAALLWIDRTGQFSRQRTAQMRQELDSGKPEYAAIVSQLQRLHQQRKAQLNSFWRDLLPGPLWIWIALALVVAAFFLWKNFVPTTIPGCDAPLVRTSLREMMLIGSLKAERADPNAGAIERPGVGAIRELGYASEPRIRGCVATIASDGAELPYAYTIAVDPATKKIAVTGASLAIATVRFGNLDGEGKFIHNAAPIGRETVERLFRARVEQMTGGFQIKSPDALLRMANQSPERSREIADIEPLAPCREVDAGLTYGCRLLVERNDVLMAALGRPSNTLLQGEFTFQRASPTAPWTLPQQFDAEFIRASLPSLRQAPANNLSR